MNTFNRNQNRKKEILLKLSPPLIKWQKTKEILGSLNDQSK